MNATATRFGLWTGLVPLIIAALGLALQGLALVAAAQQRAVAAE